MINLTINGTAVEGTAETIDVHNPATEALITTVQTASVEQCVNAIRAAQRAFDDTSWSQDAAARAAVLDRLADVMERRSDELLRAIVDDVGTPVSTAETLQVRQPIEMLRWFASVATVDRSEEIGPDPAGRSVSLIAYRPVGVVAAIAAYNYPLLLAITKIGAALAAGCTTVVLPSIQAPLAVLLLGDMLAEAEVPAGVVNIICGGPAIGQVLSEHPLVDKVSFTGSVPVGETIMRQAASTLKGLILELGGKSPALVLPSADIGAVCGPIHRRYLRNAGQGCSSPTRILVPRPSLGDFLELTREVIPKIKIGDPWERDTEIGPLISAAHRRRVEDYVDAALGDGGEIVAGGGRPEIPHGWYLNANVIAGISNSARTAREEIFGPVGVVIPYDDLDEAIAIANDSSFGLNAAVFGEADECLSLAPQLRAGTVTINGGGQMRNDAPMGGFKQSGIGRERGEAGIREFLEPQHVQWTGA